MRRRSWASYLICGVCASALCGLFSASAQTAREGPRKATAASEGLQRGPGLNLRADTILVLIPVAVTDAQNRFVLGLQKEDFHLLEDGVEQNITHFSGEDAPLSIGLVFDESGSMDYKLQTSRLAVAEFLKTMNADDQAFLVEFSDIAKRSVGFTAHTEEIETALRDTRPGGLTAMLDDISIPNVALQLLKCVPSAQAGGVRSSPGNRTPS